MKKIISLVLLATMLMGCLAPCAFAVEGPAIIAESVEKTQGADKSVNADIALENNPGTYYMKLVVYYDKTELALGDTEGAFTGSVFGADDSAVGSELAGTHTKIRNYIPSSLRSTSKGFMIELCGAYNEELEDTDVVYGDGIAVTLPFEILADDFGDYEYTVVVAEALDENGEEFELAGDVGTVTYVPDPYIGIYEDFTVFFTPADVSIDAGTESVDVDIRLDNNPGLWAVRVYIVYPETLSLDNGAGLANVDNNTGIFLSAADTIKGFPDLELTDERQAQGFMELMAADPSIVRDGYHSTTLYFERQDSYEEVYTGNGVLCSLHFTVDPSVKPGTELDIKLYYNDADFLFAGTDEVTGEPIFISYYPDVYGANISVADCPHENTTTEHLDKTCTEDGYDRVVCTDCGTVVEETIIPGGGGHITLQPGSTVTIQPDCVNDGKQTRYCDVCGEIVSEEILPAYGHDTDGEVVVVTPATCTEAGLKEIHCDFCGEVSKTEEIPPLNHPEESFKVEGRVDPTCTDEGNTGKVICGLCGVTVAEAEILPPYGHDTNGEVVILNEPTCTKAGLKEVHCYFCGKVSAIEEIPATGHTSLLPDSTVTVAPDCENDGKQTKYCDVCKEVLSEEILPSLGHDLDGGTEITVEPTCTTAGLQVTYCSFCGEVSEVKELSAFNHSSVTLTGAKKPTESSDGYTGDMVCDLCGEVCIAGEIIPAIGTGDTFTVYAKPEAYEILPDAETLDVDILLANNPGLWATRFYIVYPESLSLSDGSGAQIDNSFEIFTGVDEMTPGYPDLSLDDSRQVTAFKNLMAADPSIMREGYRSTTVYFEATFVDTVITENGVLCTLHFNVSPDVTVGDILDIEIYYGEYDFLYAETGKNGFPIFTSLEPASYGADISVICDHNYMDTVVPPTETEEGYTLHTCTVCGASYKDNFKDPIGGSDDERECGDVDGDGTVNAKDLNIIKRLVSGIVTPTPEQLAYGDVNGDGKINGMDANILARYISGSIPEL